jgi:hypothetical protein
MSGMQNELINSQLIRKSSCLEGALSYLDKEYGVKNHDAGSTQSDILILTSYHSA